MAATSLEMAELSFLVESLATGLTVSFCSTVSEETATVEGGEGDREGTGEGGEGDRLGSLIVFDLFLVRIGTGSTEKKSANGSWITEPCDGKATVDGEENDDFVGDVKGDGGEGEREVGRD
ncbi:hypothetical protein MPER_05815 [Moniliophthora perniciosa FA553]|nr:hypothetical protein MPER_05815 [Moniliophthora perniciosa FA553]